MIKSFKIYVSLLLILAVLGLSIGHKKSRAFDGERSIASDCFDTASSIIKKEIPKEISDLSALKEALELKHYHFKNSIWNKILRTSDFNEFDEFEYFRLLEIYKDSNKASKDLLSKNPVRIEQKLALIEAIELKFLHFQNLRSVQDEIENLNAYKLRKVQSLMRRFDLSKKITRENLEEFSSEFFLILKGPPVSLLDYFLKNKTARMNERMMRVLQEDMLLRGLKGTLERIPERENTTRIEQARYFIKKVMKYKVWRYLVVPYDLPWIDRVKISDELLEKIFMDGLDVHQSELIIELKNQNAIDHYERFRRAYRPVAFGIGYYFYNQHQKDLDIENEKNTEGAKKKFIDDLEKLADVINSGDSTIKTENDLKEMQFQRVLKSFKEQYHQDPTPEELKELHQKIFET